MSPLPTWLYDWRSTGILPPLSPEEGEKFVDRGITVLRIYDLLAKNEHVYVLGLAGIGKTSLLHTALAGEKKRVDRRLSMALPLHDLSREQRREVERLRERVFNDSLLIIYEVGRDGSLVLRSNVTPDRWPEDDGYIDKKAIVIVDEFHRLAWAPYKRQEQTIKAIDSMFEKAKLVQFVFAASLPVYTTLPTPDEGLIFDWALIPHLQKAPVSVAVSPILANEDTFGFYLETLREDKDRATPYAVNQVDVELIAPVLTLKSEELVKKIDEISEVEKSQIESRRGYLLRDIQALLPGHPIHPLVGLRLPKKEKHGTEGQKRRGHSSIWGRLTKIGRESRHFNREVSLLDAVVTEEGYDDLSEIGENDRQHDLVPPRRLIVLLLNANQRIFFEYAKYIKSRSASVLSVILRALFVGGMFVLSQWMAIKPNTADWVLDIINRLASVIPTDMMAKDMMKFFFFLIVLIVYLMFGWGYTTITPPTMAVKWHKRLSIPPIAIILISVLIVVSLQKAPGYYGILDTLTIITIVTILPITYHKVYYNSGNVFTSMFGLPLLAELPWRKVFDSLLSRDVYAVTSIASILWSSMWLLVPFLYIPQLQPLVSHIWLALSLSAIIAWSVSYNIFPSYKPMSHIGSLKRYIFSFLLFVVLPTTHAVNHVIAMFVSLCVFIIITTFSVIERPKIFVAK